MFLANENGASIRPPWYHDIKSRFKYLEEGQTKEKENKHNKRVHGIHELLQKLA